jgi:hypothetical protein
VKLKLSQIIEAQEPLKRLAAEKYPAHIAYRIQRNIRVLAPEALAYEKARMELIKNKYGVELKGEGVPTGSYRVPPEKVAEYTGEIQLLLDEKWISTSCCSNWNPFANQPARSDGARVDVRRIIGARREAGRNVSPGTSCATGKSRPEAERADGV